MRFVRSLPLLRSAAVSLITILAAVSSPAALAQQQPAAAGSSASVEDLKALTSSLEDESKRKELLASIRALIAARESAAQAEAPTTLSERIATYGADVIVTAESAVGDLSAYFGDWSTLVRWFQRVIGDPAARADDTLRVLAFAAIFAAGWAAEYAAWRALASSRARLEGAALRSGLGHFLPIVARSLLDFVPLAAFAGAAYLMAVLIGAPASVATLALNVVNAYLVASGLMAFARLLLSPTARSLRLLRLRDATATGLFVWFRRFVGVGVGGYFLIATLLLLGLPRRGLQALFAVLGAVLATLAVLVILRHRREVAVWLRRKSASASHRFGAAQLFGALAGIWHVLAIAYVLGFFVVAAFDIKGGFAFMLRSTLLSLSIVAAAGLVLFAVARLLGWIASDAALAGTRHSSLLRIRVSHYLPVARAIARSAVLTGTALLLIQAWGIDSLDWLRNPLGQRALGAVVSISLVIAVAIAIWEVASAAIERFLTHPQRSGTAVQRSARMRTLLPLLRKALFIFLAVMVVLISLSEIGVDIGPLLAGAGVVGLAIGFGAQKLVQDVITGVFMLVEDALAVGDVVTVAGASGVVEDLSIRSIRLRDLSGNVHTVPFSSVDTVTNMTKGFSYYPLDIGVAYREDPDKVGQACRDIVDEMRREPAYAVDILEPLEVLGLDQFADSALIIKARIKTRPSRQWIVGREFNRRMKKRFDELGIEMPFPHRTVYLGETPAVRVRIEGAAAPASSIASPPSPAVSPPSTSPPASQ